MKYFFNIIFTVCFMFFSCGQSVSNKEVFVEKSNDEISQTLFTGAENFELYKSLLEHKKVGVLTNQSGIISKLVVSNQVQKNLEESISIIDFFLQNKVEVTTIFAPEHGFRGNADAGELIKDGKDTKTGLPIVSLYGSNKKPTTDQLKNISVMVFDLQDVGVRFYTYISSLHYVMEACAENKIPLIVLDRPNPNGQIIDGPVLEMKNQSFVGMHPIPVLHGMTIGEYARMINGEKWLKNGIQCDLKVVPCGQYDHQKSYSLPVRPSPNLPNDQSTNLYASLCFFEGTNVSVGRGTEKQFQIFGAPFLKNYTFSFTPKPNLGAKQPLHEGLVCYGKDLSEIQKVTTLNLEWLLEAYQNTEEKSGFFNSFFIKLSGTEKLQQQIIAGKSAAEIRATWQDDLEKFQLTRKKYLIYP
uniref:exo-beta-N-acetylmuramidase NamZ family protein n=1 Tax=Flavobacterium sp. TaxID=239 RepID=UPI004049ED10